LEKKSNQILDGGDKPARSNDKPARESNKETAKA
jgi:hypothetical protein